MIYKRFIVGITNLSLHVKVGTSPVIRGRPACYFIYKLTSKRNFFHQDLLNVLLIISSDYSTKTTFVIYNTKN
jgi:hypothetical protein